MRTCTADKPDTGAYEHVVTPKLTSVYTIDVGGKPVIARIRTEYKCIHCGLEIGGIQETEL